MNNKLGNVLDWLKGKSVDYADCRYVRTEKESIQVTDGTVDSLSKVVNVGVGVRVLHNGAWGFAAVASTGEADIKKAANKALQTARASASAKKESVKLAEQEAFKDHYATPCEKDPFAVPTDEKIGLLLEICEKLKTDDKIKMAKASLDFYRTNKLFFSTEGAEIEQDIIESGGGYEVVASDGNEVQKRSYPNSHRGDYATRGYEFIDGLQLLENVDKTREEAIQLLTADDCPDTETDIIICGSQMALQVHESCGHPSELDRVLGTEISLAGGSFMQPDGLNNLKYGSDIVNIFADATIPGALGSFGYDDEGVKAQRAPIIKEGVHVGYLTSRETAPIVGKRSNGTMRADGWNRIPLIRMTNINLEPGEWELDDLIADTKRGIFFDMNKVWSIDDKRLNFQFGVECAWEIKDGKLGRMFKNPLYTGMTPKFWNSCDAICNHKHWRVWGVPNCGKGEPMQTARVAHGTAPTRFRKVKVGVSK
ncbi:MAG: peptidase C69 [candidate division Zixibacteria bacterium HGW-Zixibacteria-1]|nr:MAG: peptidase C69 [candidate division Zixibacteria bacterium HGW-Zixibacteria-1]